jgi:hypothetical protein
VEREGPNRPSDNPTPRLVGFAHVADKARGACVGAVVCAVILFVAASICVETSIELLAFVLVVAGTVGMLYGALFSGGRIGWVGGGVSAGCISGFLFMYVRFMRLDQISLDRILLELIIVLPLCMALGFLVGAVLELRSAHQGKDDLETDVGVDAPFETKQEEA